MDGLDYIKQRSRQNNTVVSIRVQYNTAEEISGITCLAVQPYADLFENLFCLGKMHKYYHKADKWLSFGVYNTSPSMVDLVSYADEKWEEDSVLKKICDEKMDDSGKITKL